MTFARITASQYPLKKVFSDDFVFQIPYYQRPYAWTTEEARDLLEDIMESMESMDPMGASCDELNPYFLGSIVLIKEDDVGKPDAQVVDGQQRLATTTILLSVLRDLCNDTKYAAGLSKYIIQEGNPVDGTEDTYRLTLSERDKEFFQRHIQTIGNIEQLTKMTTTDNYSQKNIRDNAKLFYEILKGNTEKGLKGKTEEERKQLAEFIVKQCCMVVVSTPDSDSAYRIFSILNDRGLNLSHADILKSELIGTLKKELHEDYANLWEDTEDQLGRNDFINLFSHIRMIKRRMKLRKDILNEFREYVIKPINDPRKVIEEIVEYGDIYDDIKNAEYSSDSYAEEINAKLRWLNHIDNADWLPPAIYYMSKHHNNPKNLMLFFNDLERLAAGLMILRADVNERIKRYGHILEAIEIGQNLYDETPISEPDQAPLQLTQTERDRIIDALKGDLFFESQFKLYVLLRLNDASLEEGVKFDYKSVTVEHVLPQTLPKGGNWAMWFSESEHIKYRHKLGNLILLTGRKNKGNDEFEIKRQKYLNEKKGGIASFPLSVKAIQDNKTMWNKDVIDSRQEDMIEKLKTIWRL